MGKFSLEEVATHVVDAAFKVHKALGPGLLESAYEAALYFELTRRGLKVKRQVPVRVTYEGFDCGIGFRIDLLVEDLVIVELKAVRIMIEIYESQILTHLKLAEKEIGFLINFHTKLFKNGIQRYRV